jgi:cytochrome c oxidase accessory protein FixG
MRLDKAPLGIRKVGLKAAKHAVWVAIALWTGFTFVGYFTPIEALIAEIPTLSLGPWETFWIGFYGFATYGNAGWMREQVCKYMCPYSRFQSVMFDPDTLVITYDAQRGEPRGARGRSIDPKAAGLGHCVDCSICVQVCPAGIDIRAGLQYECIGCAACIDGCDQVMDKLGYPRGLIRYSTENAMKGGSAAASIVRRVLRPRVLAYVTILSVLVATLAAGLYLRTPLKVDVIRDRAALARETPEGLVENVYKLQIMNTQERPARYGIHVSGIDGLSVIAKQPIAVPAASTQAVAVTVRVDPTGKPAGSHEIFFRIEDIDEPSVATREKSRFFVRP